MVREYISILTDRPILVNGKMARCMGMESYTTATKSLDMMGSLRMDSSMEMVLNTLSIRSNKDKMRLMSSI